MREKLMQLIASKHELLINLNTSIPKLFQLTEHLIENGVTIPVRCKDCKWVEKGKDYEAYCNHWKSGLYANVKDDDFCSYGERKDKE